MNAPTTALDVRDVQMLQIAMRIANRNVVADIETNALRVFPHLAGRWYDTRPMLDPREHCGPVLDMLTEALAYAEQAGLVRRHATERWLVCITPEAP